MAFIIVLIKIKLYFCTRNSGCSSVRLEYASGGRVVASSNLVIPTIKYNRLQINHLQATI